ncbi:MAG TPA: SCO family protein [Steroidobacteraceae bacterium]|nr:SCO family protein [Steroidobacteraceae bacterium]
MKAPIRLALLAAFAASAAASPAAALHDAAALAFTQHPGAKLPQVQFRDADGGRLSLRQAAGGLPLILILGYFRCPNLCAVTRASLYRALGAAALQPGRDYSLAAISIDPHEDARSAQEAKAADLAAFKTGGSSAALHYLTGDQADIDAVAAAVGFHDRWDYAARQFLHPAGITIATQDARVSGYLLGVGYRPSAVRDAVFRAATGAPPAYANPILLLCFHYDPSTGRYSVAVLKLMRLAAILTVVMLLGVLYLLFRRERKPA